MVIIRNLVLFVLLVSILPCSSLRCFECECDSSATDQCNCATITSSTDNDYCVILEQRYTDETYIQLSRVPRNSSWVYIEDPYFVLTQESIRYNRTTSQWFLWTNSIVFGCDWDLCNTPSFIESLPNSFKLNISTNWLNTNIYGSGAVSTCIRCDTEVCGNASNPGDFSQCTTTTCNTTSAVGQYFYRRRRLLLNPAFPYTFSV